MDENTKAFVEVGKKLHKDNEATLAELKKINKAIKKKNFCIEENCTSITY